MTKLLSCLPSVVDKTVLINNQAINLQELIEMISGPDKGAVVTFSGNIRNIENGIPIRSIVYETYLEMAQKEIYRIIESAQKRWNAKIAVHHRISNVPVSETSLGVACSHAHRKEAFEACQFVIDEIKQKAPIWKVEYKT